jgi:RHS repeat-associated protein
LGSAGAPPAPSGASPEVQIILTTFDNADRPVAVTVGSGTTMAQTTTQFYNELGQTWRALKPDGTSVTNEFYTTGQLKRTFGSQTYPVEYTYDYAGRMKTMKTWQNFATDSGAAVTTWNYHAQRGFLSSKQYADSQGPAYAYNSGGRLQTRTWARTVGGQPLTTTYGYNNAGDLTTVDYSDSTPDVAYTYDRRGRQITASGTGSSALAYNDAGQLLSESWSTGPLAGLSVTNGYDGLLRRSSISILDAQSSILASTAYGYDSASRLSTVSDGTHSATYDYLANSRLVQNITFKQGTTTRMTTAKQFDNLTRLTSIGHSAGSTVLSSHAYAYNTANQRTRADLQDGSHWRYQYDDLGQVISGRKHWADNTPVAGQQFGYAFDDIGNRTGTSAGGDRNGLNLRSATYSVNSLNQYTSRTVPGAVDILGSAATNATVTVNHERAERQETYYRHELALDNSAGAVWQSVTNLAILSDGTNTDVESSKTGNAFLPAATESFVYDADGNITSNGRWAFTWNAENRLVRMIAATAVGPQQRIDFEYDCWGRRIGKKVWNNTAGTGNPAVEQKFLYDGWNLIAVLNSQGSIVQSFLWGTDLSGGLQGAGGVGGLLAVSDAQSGTHFSAFDGNGNVVALVTSANSDVSASYEYGPFGELVRANGSMALSNPFRFSTKYHDDESDLVYYGYRYYQASTGKWLSRDPIGEQGGRNLYGTGSDLINFIDPFGLALYAFDGTGNNHRQVRKGKYTHVLTLSADYRGQAFYYAGVGSSFATRGVGGLTGAGGGRRIEKAYRDFLAAYESGDTDVDIIGFSRGAALAREFANVLNKRGYKGCPVKIRFIGLFDTVGSFGIPGNHVNLTIHMDLPANVETARQAIAEDERRFLFPLTPLNSAGEGQDFDEQRFPGDHSDIGRGHGNDSNDLSRAPLEYIWNAGINAGVPFGPLPAFVPTGNTTPHDLSVRFPHNLFPKRPR